MTMSIDEVLKRVKAGESDAYAIVVWEYSPRIHAYFASRLSDPQAVEDLAQETFIAGFQNLHRFRGDAAFSTWLTSIARHKMLDYLRRRGTKTNAIAQLRYELLVSTMDPFDHFNSEEQQRQITKMKSCLQELSPTIRSLVASRYLEGESVNSLAERLSRTVASIHSTLFRARRQLRLCMIGEIDA